MINKRLLQITRESKKYIAANVVCQWCCLLANMIIMACMADLLSKVSKVQFAKAQFITVGMVIVAAVIVRFFGTILAGRMSYLSSRAVKGTLRELLYKKLLEIGVSYRDAVHTSEVVQVAVEGIEQLETYFGAYLPQFFYAMLAPVTLFLVLCFVNVPSAVVLFVCVPLIPIAIAAVQTWAKKLLSKYWDQYAKLGDSFLENLQGLTTLKLYQADEAKHREMNVEAEEFRKITMKVLTMQLNSITIMDLVAYGGAALGIIMAVTQYRADRVSLAGCFFIILLAADFFIPMRQLGSFFHIAMNGMAASDKIFRVLDLSVEDKTEGKEMSAHSSIVCENLCFSYEKDEQVLHNLNLSFPYGSFTALVGESGCGKSTIAAILTGKKKGYTGDLTIGGIAQREISEKSLMHNITYIGHNSYLFKGTVRENLLMGKETALDEELWHMLERVKLADFLRSEQGLDTTLTENAVNLSGGQRQRLALARALLHDSQCYIFDEATSNIDVESENAIMEQIYELAKTKTVILISHRLANVTGADTIYVLKKGKLEEQGTHQELLSQKGYYETLFMAQKKLEMEGVC